MRPDKSHKKGEKGKDIRQIALLTAVPTILIAAPLAGFFIGRWADGKFDTEPLLTITGLILGFAAAGREIYIIVKRASAEEKSDDNQHRF